MTRVAAPAKAVILANEDPADAKPAVDLLQILLPVVGLIIRIPLGQRSWTNLFARPALM